MGATTVSAQEAGSMWVGGSAGISSSKTGDADRVTKYKIIPEFGYVLSENMGIGVRVGYDHPGKDANGYEVAPFLRYSFLKGDIGSLFFDGGLGYSHLKTKGAEGDVKTNGFSVGIEPGVAINVSENVKVLGHFGFLGYTNTKTGTVKTNSFGLDLDMTRVTFGVNYHF